MGTVVEQGMLPGSGYGDGYGYRCGHGVRVRVTHQNPSGRIIHVAIRPLTEDNMRNIQDVIRNMIAAIGDNDKSLTAALAKIARDSPFTAPECMGMRWNEVSFVHLYAAPLPGQPNEAQPDWWQHAGEILAGTRDA